MLDLEKIERETQVARDELARLCNGKRFTMCIPVREDDSDIAISNALNEIPELIQRVRELEAAVTETRRLLLGRAHYFDEQHGEFTKVSLDEIHAVLKEAGAPL